MKLQQLRYIWEVSHHNLNVSATALSLYTSQPGISKQIRLLEDELGVEIFSRSGKHLTRITPAGEKIIIKAEEILRIVNSIKQIAQEFTNEQQGNFSVAASHTQAKYALPHVVHSFIKNYPDVEFNLHQGTSAQIAEIAANGNTDLAIISEYNTAFNNLIMMPCYQWNKAILVPKNHPLTQSSVLTIEEVARFPLISYVCGFGANHYLEDAFINKGLSAQVSLTATDAEVIKTYVRLNFGVGIIAEMTFDPLRDSDLVCLNASHLFKHGVAQIGFRKGSFIRSFMYEFIQLIAPHLNRELIDKAISCHGKAEMNQLLNSIEIPVR